MGVTTMGEEHGPLEIRTASEVIGVSFPQRRIELIVMPYETETQIVEPGRRYTEIVARGAFDGIQRRTRKINVYSDHQVSVASTLGKTVALYPNREEGLVADLVISKAREDVLIMADEGLLDASAGFAVMAAADGKPRGEEWRDARHRRLTRLWLGHIALTPEPAYPGTHVLAVRDVPGAADSPAEDQPARVATPNLDRFEMDRLRRVAADLDRRYSPD